MKTYWGVEVYFQAFLTSTLDGSDWSALRPGRFTPGEGASSTHTTGGWADPRTGPNAAAKEKNILPL